MRRAFAVLLVVLAGGCGGGDRLKPGDEVLVTAEGKVTEVMIDASNAKGRHGPNLASLGVGTKVRVVDDSEPDGSSKDGSRFVRIKVMEGEEDGVLGTIPRTSLTSP